MTDTDILMRLLEATLNPTGLPLTYDEEELIIERLQQACAHVVVDAQSMRINTAICYDMLKRNLYERRLIGRG